MNEPLLGMPVATILPATGAMGAAMACLLGSAGVALLLRAWRRVAGTTLVAPWCWALVALAAITGSAVGQALAAQQAANPDQHAALSPLAYMAAMSTFCPLMAVLGAKRPQDPAWQFIVLSLWLVLALPGIEWGLFDKSPELHAARRWFLLILVAIGLLTYLPTRFWLAGLLFTAGQWRLDASFMPGGDLHIAPDTTTALALYLAALVAASFYPRRPAGGEPLDRTWRDFRDQFGSLWGLRVVERVNTAARLVGWPIRLGWGGFIHESAAPNEPLPPELREALTDNLRNLLRRFVSAEWLAERLETADEQARKHLAD